MSSKDFRNVPRRKLRDDVLEQLRAAVADGRYAPGEELPSERELMAAMNVGRPAVREALIAMELTGMITVTHGRRARVRETPPGSVEALVRQIGAIAANVIDRDGVPINDLAEARFVFERAIVDLAALRATSADILVLKRALEANRRSIASDEEYLATDMALHKAIARLSGNLLLETVGELFYTWIPRIRVSMVHVDGANLLSYREHSKIVDRIAAHDRKGAVEAIEAHLLRSHSLYRRVVESNSALPGAVQPAPVVSPRSSRSK